LDGILCKRCTCKSCGKDAHTGYNCPSKVPVISISEPYNSQTINELPQALPNFHPTFHSEAESPFTLDSTPTYVDESFNVFNPPPQPPVYPCEFYGNDAYFGHYCTPQTRLSIQSRVTIKTLISRKIFKMFRNITPTEPIDSLSMGDEHLDTIPAMESDEFIKDCACSIGTVEDKILVPKPPKNCAQYFQNTSEPSNASTNVVNAPREPYVVKQDNESFIDKIIFDLNRAPDSPNQFHCFHRKDVLRDGEACKRCTCAKFGSGLSKGFCYISGHHQNS
nr:hypothetical protein [Tanacetum cinerariifolium]